MKKYITKINESKSTYELEMIVFELAEEKQKIASLPNKSEAFALTAYVNDLQWLAKRRISQADNNEYKYYRTWYEHSKTVMPIEMFSELKIKTEINNEIH